VQGESGPVALYRLVAGNHRRYGGYLSHLGVLLLAVGITASSTFRMEKEQTVRPGGAVTLGGYTVRLDKMWAEDEPQRTVVGADLFVERGGKRVGTMSPRMNYYRVSEQPVATPAVRSRADADLYVNLMANEPDGSSATLRVLVEPFVMWIWVGGLVVAIGALISLWPGGRRGRPVVPTVDPLESGDDEAAEVAAGGAL